MKKKTNDVVTKQILQQELKKLSTTMATKKELQEGLKKLEAKLATKEEVKKLEQRVNQMDRSLMVFKGEVYNQFQSVEDKISQSQDKVLGVLSDVMGELQTIRDEKDISSGRTYENMDRIENHEIRIWHFWCWHNLISPPFVHKKTSWWKEAG